MVTTELRETGSGGIRGTMLKERIVIRSETDKHALFKVFKAYYLKTASEVQPYSEHHHSEFEISIIQSGSGIYNCAGVDYEFHAGDVFMHCGNDIHRFKRIDRQECLSLLVIQFEPRFIWARAERSDLKYVVIFRGGNNIGRHISGDSPHAKAICGLMNAAFEECQSKRPAYEMFVKANLLLILAYLARHFYDDLSIPKFQVKLENMENLEKLEHSMNYILGHLEEELTLDQLAREAGMSRSYYSAMFKTFNGVTVWNYITNQRIDKARYLLEDTNQSIIEISGNCGFSNISNFNRAFKKITGKTPREYRKGCE